MRWSWILRFSHHHYIKIAVHILQDLIKANKRLSHSTCSTVWQSANKISRNRKASKLGFGREIAKKQKRLQKYQEILHFSSLLLFGFRITLWQGPCRINGKRARKHITSIYYSKASHQRYSILVEIMNHDIFVYMISTIF